MTALAKPTTDARTPQARPEGPRAERAAHPSLRSHQTWFVNAVMTPESEPLPDGSSEAESRLTAGPSMDARARLEIYRRAYHGRLIECLLDDYPAVSAALGESSFEALCRAYIARHPSGGPSLNSFGRSMARFCRERPLPALACPPAFIADLAALEWAMVEVIHAPSAPPFTLLGMADLPAECWATARVVTTPALRLLRSQFPVNAFFQAFRDGGRHPVPEAHPEATLVYRNGPTVWRMALTEPMFELLQALVRGDSLGGALERATAAFAGISEELAARQVTTWFRDWVAGGLFAGVQCA
ncbi:MAG: putative DNA-binding domain-containing protein [Myxococcota bacterium]|nr:putative DNA-binding domain-containing protein [Myxococcota bacterium]